MERIVPTVVLLAAIILCVTMGTTAERKYTIREGDNLLVICNVSHKSSDLYVYWTKNDTKSNFYQDGDRLEILEIKSAASGDYVCHALNTSLPEPDFNETNINRTVEVITVDVQYAARINSFSIEPYTLMENQTFSISCDFQGNPGPIWSIRNRDTGLAFLKARHIGSNTIMTSPPAQCDYTGYWECTGHNRLSHGVNVTRGHNVTVLCSPRPAYQRNNYSVTSFVGRVAFLILNVHAHPAPNYTWSRDDGSNFTSSVIQHDFDNMSILEFNNVSIPDFGDYTVKMENQYGINYAHYQLKANGKPEAPTNIQASGVTDYSVTLKWTPGYDMGSRQYFMVMKLFEGSTEFTQLSPRIYCNYTNFGRNQTCTYQVTNLYSDTHYYVTIAAENENGFLILSKESVKFTTKERPPAPAKETNKTEIVITGAVVGTLCIVAMVAFVFYLFKYRKYKTSYEVKRENQIIGRKEEKLYGSHT